MSYTWTAPVNNRTSGSNKMTYTDMNRITQNVAYLQEQMLGSATISQTSWITNDIISLSFWTELLTAILDLCDLISLTPLAMTNDMEYNNINNVEQLSLNIYNAITGTTFVPITDQNGNAITIHDGESLVIPVY